MCWVRSLLRSGAATAPNPGLCAAEMTASEPLTLEEEYKMQKSWQEDGDSACRGAPLARLHRAYPPDSCPTHRRPLQN